MDLEYECISSDEECFAVTSSYPPSPSSSVYSSSSSSSVSEWERDVEDIELEEPNDSVVMLSDVLCSTISNLRKCVKPFDTFTPVHFIIGGVTFISSYDTLSKVSSESPLKRICIIDGVHTTRLDRDPLLFPFILKFLRNGHISHTSLPGNLITLSDLMEEAKYFYCEGLVNVCREKIVSLN